MRWTCSGESKRATGSSPSPPSSPAPGSSSLNPLPETGGGNERRVTCAARGASVAGMANRLRPLAELKGDQLRASRPRDHDALSASAGTGKTHVLTARVLRLLLSGVHPPSVIFLTFTKAGAAEMAERIHDRLAYWERLMDF